MERCNDFDRTISLGREQNNYAEQYIKTGRQSFNQEWQDYQDYLEYNDWREDYGM